MGSEQSPGTAYPDGLRSLIDNEVVRPCLEIAFRPGELRDFTAVETAYSDDLNPGPAIELRIETSAGDVQIFPVWQSDVPSLETAAGMRNNLLWQLEQWLPESRLRWGQNVRLRPDPGTEPS